MSLQLPSPRRAPRVACGLTALALLALPGFALEDVRSALSGIPWLQRVVRDGISLQVDLELLTKREDNLLREKDRLDPAMQTLLEHIELMKLHD